MIQIENVTKVFKPGSENEVTALNNVSFTIENGDIFGIIGMAAAGDFSAFSAWYRPGGAGGTSFPSGHTAAACGIFLLLLLPVVFDALKSKATLLAGISLGFIAFSAFCRVWIGRHFLSDTAAAAIIMTAVFLLIIQNPLFAKRLAGMQAMQYSRIESGNTVYFTG